ncbi:hypothetical protein Tco_0380883 [Tanacetum coccineum]
MEASTPDTTFPTKRQKKERSLGGGPLRGLILCRSDSVDLPNTPAVERGEIGRFEKQDSQVIYREVVRGGGGEGEVDESEDDKKPRSDCKRENDNKPSLDHERENVSSDERRLSGGDVFGKKIESVLRTDEDHDNRLIMDEVKPGGGDEKVELVDKTYEKLV